MTTIVYLLRHSCFNCHPITSKPSKILVRKKSANKDNSQRYAMSYVRILTESLSKASPVPVTGCPLLLLPSEFLNAVLKLLDIFDRTKLALTCRHFASFGSILGFSPSIPCICHVSDIRHNDIFLTSPREVLREAELCNRSVGDKHDSIPYPSH